MKVLMWGLFLYCFAFLLHLIIWKIRLPKRQTKTLLFVFFGTLGLGLGLLWSLTHYVSFKVFAPETLVEYLHISLFVSSLTLAYMITYSALEVDSPSLVMIMTIAHAEPEGLAKEKFYQLMTDELLIKPRIQDVLRDNLVYMDGQKYKLTAKGVLFARLFIFYRQLLNLPQKGG